MFEQIEKLKQEFTDKYVVVDANFPELSRFEGQVGQIKTVNMSGRALVEFGARSNIGWYDIELDCLKVVPKPDPNAAAARPAKHEAPAAKAAAAPAAAPAAAGAKKSTADILAAARAAKAAGGAAPARPAAPAAEKSAAPAAQGKLSTADILAAARAKKSAEAAAAPAAEAPAAKEAPAASAPAKAAPKPGGDKLALPKGQRPTVSEMLAWCRAHDTK